MSESNRASLRQLASDLRKLHKLLIDYQSRIFGAVGTPFDHLQLVTTHPDFAWLRILSEFMVEIDERLDEEAAPSNEELLTFKSALEKLIGPAPASQAEFREKYLGALHDSPELTIQHGAVRLALGKLERRPA